MRAIFAGALVVFASCADDGGSGPNVSSRVERKMFPLGTLGVACFEGQLLDTDEATPGLQLGCSATIETESTEPEVLPACGGGRTPCYTVEEHQACDLTPTHLAVDAKGYKPGSILTIECLLVE